MLCSWVRRPHVSFFLPKCNNNHPYMYGQVPRKMNQSKWCKNADTAENEPLQWCRNIRAVNKKRGSESLSGHELPKKRASKELLHNANKKRPSWKDVSLAQLESQTPCTLEVTLSILDWCLDKLDSWQDSWHQSSAAPINWNTVNLVFGP